MGEITELILEGVLCEGCGVVIDDVIEGYDGACGYPRRCGDCGGDPAVNGARSMSHKRARHHSRRRKSKQSGETK